MYHPAVASAVLLGGAGTGAWGMIHPQSQFFGRTIRFTGDPSSIALTFDDGPNPAATPELLDLLDQYGVRATFFLIGTRARAFPVLVREIAARGHVIGNHTETHPNLGFFSREKLREEISGCRESLASVNPNITEKMRWMRPPFGSRGPQLSPVVRSLGYDGVVMWSKWAWDWKPQTAENVIRRLGRVCGGDIVLLHDGDYRLERGDRRHTIAALAHWLPLWKSDRIRFVTMDEVRPESSGMRAA